MRKVFVGGSLASLAAIIAAWIAIGVGNSDSGTACPLPAFPDATCTGVPTGTTLTPVPGNMEITVSNTVVSGKDLEGCFVVRAPGVTIQNSRMECVVITGDAAANGADRTSIKDSEINCETREGTSYSGEKTGLQYNNFTASRLEIYDCENGFSVGHNYTIQNSYVHDLYQCPIAGCPEPGSPHTDGIQSAPDGSNGLINHNTIHGEGTGCVWTADHDGTCNGSSAIRINSSGTPCDPSVCPQTHDVIISNNLLSGGSYTLNCPNHAVQVPPVNFNIVNNRFSTAYHSTVGEYGWTYSCADDENSSGNIFYPSGDPVTIE